MDCVEWATRCRYAATESRLFSSRTLVLFVVSPLFFITDHALEGEATGERGGVQGRLEESLKGWSKNKNNEDKAYVAEKECKNPPGAAMMAYPGASSRHAGESPKRRASDATAV